jgi:uncharacterized repeat protein (TIGR03803 family)
MKKFFLFSAIILSAILSGCYESYAQGIYQLWGTAQYGGPDDRGLLFSTKYDGSGQTIKKHFAMQYPGNTDLFNVPVLCNGKLYILMAKGGASEDAIITEYNPATSAYTQRADLMSLGVVTDESALTMLNNKLYGISRNGGQYGFGFIYEFNPASGALTVKHNLDSLQGAYPSGELLVYNNKLFGTASKGGNLGEGVVYELDPATNIFTVRAHLNAITTEINGDLTLYNNRFWNAEGASGICSFNPATNAVVKHADLDAIGLMHSYGKLTVLNNKLYGVANEGGAFDEGAIFEFNPVTNALVTEFDFTGSTAQRRCELYAYNGKLYSASYFSNSAYDGMIFSYDPVTNTYENKVFFGPNFGKYGAGRMMMYNGKFYGLTCLGATYNEGCLYEYDPANNGYTKKVEFGGTDLYYPSGKLLYYNNKIYGTATGGGSNEDGGIYEYDPLTQQFSIKVHMEDADGRFLDQGGLVAYNGKFYGVTRSGGAASAGTIFEYNPATNIYTKWHDFNVANGKTPYSGLVEMGGKLYGTALGSANDQGNIFEFNPVTHTYAEKVVFGGVMGTNPYAGLTAYNGKLYGVTRSGGPTGDGVLFEYDPGPNSYQVKAEFDFATTGTEAVASLSVYNGKLYGILYSGGTNSAGSVYEFNPASGTLDIKLPLTSSGGRLTLSGMTLLNNRFYGLMSTHGSTNDGTLFEYNPVSNSYTKKFDFTGANGRRPRRSELIPIPAPVAPGSPGSCLNTANVTINTTNANTWIPFTDNQGRAVAEINANGNILGNTTVQYFVNDGSVRTDGNGVLYLDRNITITSAIQPVTPVSIRLYVRKAEFQTLQATAGSGVTIPSDLAIFKNDDLCSPNISTAAVKLVTAQQSWGTDYVYSADVSSFSSFYFASGNNVVLPLHLLSFSGSKEKDHNELNWKAVCSNAIHFILERSTDGIRFTGIASIPAAQADCDRPFQYKDYSPEAGNNFYRLKMEDMGSIAFSNIVLLQRDRSASTEVQFIPNPVVGNQAGIRVIAGQSGTISLVISDVTGRTVATKTIQADQGITHSNLDISQLNSGIYYARYYNGTSTQAVKFVKQ